MEEESNKGIKLNFNIFPVTMGWFMAQRDQCCVDMQREEGFVLLEKAEGCVDTLYWRVVQI